MLKSNHVILVIIIIGAVVSTSVFIEFSQVEPPANARFIDVGILGEGEMIDDIPVIRLGHSATITLDVEKLSAAPIKDIMIRSYLTNSENGEFLLIDNSIMHTSLKMSHDDYLQYRDDNIETDPFQGTDKTGIMMITITAINSPLIRFNEIVNVVLYADDVEMDRLAFDVIVKNKGI